MTTTLCTVAFLLLAIFIYRLRSSQERGVSIGLLIVPAAALACIALGVGLAISKPDVVIENLSHLHRAIGHGIAKDIANSCEHPSRVLLLYPASDGAPSKLQDAEERGFRDVLEPMGFSVEIRPIDFSQEMDEEGDGKRSNPLQELQLHHEGNVGAVVSFVGIVPMNRLPRPKPLYYIRKDPTMSVARVAPLLRSGHVTAVVRSKQMSSQASVGFTVTASDVSDIFDHCFEFIRARDLR